MFLYSESCTLGWFTLGWHCCLNPVYGLSTTALFPGIKEFTTRRKYYRVPNIPRVCLEARFSIFWSSLVFLIKQWSVRKYRVWKLHARTWTNHTSFCLLRFLVSWAWSFSGFCWVESSTCPLRQEVFVGSYWGDRNPSSKRSLCPRWTVLLGEIASEVPLRWFCLEAAM